MRLTDEVYWNSGYEAIQFQEATGGYLETFLDKHISPVTEGTCLEIGSFPGSYLPVIGRKGYTLHGVDFNKKNATELPRWLTSLDLKAGEFWSADFFDFTKTHHTKYDLVCSFGFIEHFENYQEVIQSHLNLVKPGGKVIITTPNFKGWMQYLPHRIFDNENLKKHNLKSMTPGAWANLLRANNFDVSFQGYFGHYYFWVDTMQRRSKTMQFFLTCVNRVIFNLNKLIKKSGKESRNYSAFCGIVAVRKP